MSQASHGFVTLCLLWLANPSDSALKDFRTLKAVRDSYKEILHYQIAQDEGSSQFYLKSYNNGKIIEFVIQGNQTETSNRVA